VDLDTIYYPSRTNPRHISSMVLDEKGNLWFTKSANFGEYWIYSSGNILESDSLDNGYETTGFICFKLDNSGNIWLMGTHGKLMKFDIEKEYWYDMNEKYSLDFEVGIRINTLDFDKNNNLYFTTTRSFQSPVKLYSYNGNEFEISTIDSLYPEDTFSKILSYMAFDNDNNLYLAADEVGLFKLNASTTSVTTSTLDKIKIYPNPAKNELNFDLGSELVKSITITDLTGKKIITYNSELNNLNSIDISALITGQYFISFEITDQSVINKKFVKE